MSLSKEDIIDAVAEMSVMEVVELVEAMEEKFGVQAAAAVAVAGVASTAAEEGPEEEEQTEFEAVLSSFGDSKVQVIKALRGITQMDLKSAKALVDSAPASLKSGISKEEADEIKSKLEEVGATVEIK